MTTTTTNECRYLCAFTHHRGGGSVAAMFANDARPRAEAHAKAQSVEHPSANVEVVAICETGQRILATWTNGRRNGAPRWIAYAASLALFALTLSPASAQPAAPDGCAIAGTTGEGFPVAQCQDGTIWYQDMDGAGGYESGLPIVEPGTWVPMSHESPVFP
jgi:hypothetical protein